MTTHCTLCNTTDGHLETCREHAKPRPSMSMFATKADYDAAVALAATPAVPEVASEPVSHQFYDEESETWCNFMSKKHHKATEAAGYKIRPLYATPPSPAPAAQTAQAVQALNGVPQTMRHGEGAYARCSYCRRYSLDPATLSDRQPMCECGKQHGWCGSFVRPDANSTWSGKAPEAAPPTQAIAGDVWQPIETAPAVNGKFFFCRLAWGEDDDPNTGDGFRWNGQWFASAVFHRLGQERNYAFRELPVNPTHWMPLPAAPQGEKQ